MTVDPAQRRLVRTVSNMCRMWSVGRSGCPADIAGTQRYRSVGPGDCLSPSFFDPEWGRLVLEMLLRGVPVPPAPRSTMAPMWKRLLAALAAFTLIFLPTTACGDGGGGGEDTEEEEDD
jgi:hypothetical protein